VVQCALRLPWAPQHVWQLMPQRLRFLRLRESELLLADPAAKAGEVALSQGVEYRHQLARGVRKGSSYVATGLLVSWRMRK
jgi:hypothetical protein